MSIDRTTSTAPEEQTWVVEGRAGIGAEPGVGHRALARHLAAVAALAMRQKDRRLAEHLIDVAYDVATEW